MQRPTTPTARPPATSSIRAGGRGAWLGGPDPETAGGGAGRGGLGPVAATVGTLAIVGVAIALVAALLLWARPATPTTGPGSQGPSGSAAASSGAASAPVSAASVLTGPRPAPTLALFEPSQQPFTLASLRGRQVLVFFGYTHCPDVCPATIGTLGEVLGSVGTAGGGTSAVFVTVDPERDTFAWLSEYTTFLPKGFTALTGTPAQIRATADAWGVRYARVESTTPGAYSMSHTADVFLVDAAGQIRADFPFGTGASVIADVVRTVAASTPASSSAPSAAIPSAPPSAPVASVQPSAPASASGASPAAPSASVAPSDLSASVVSSSVWADPNSPVILSLADGTGPLTDRSVQVTVQLRDQAGSAVGPPVAAVNVRPAGVQRVSQIVTLAIPSAGPWRLDVQAVSGGRTRSASVEVIARDPGQTPAIGSAAPTAHTPTLDDVGGVARAVTTDPQPDLRLSRTSTTDALADGRSFVLVVDSVRFRVSPACGKAVVMARYLQDRWPDTPFIHLEPFRYQVIEDTAVLDGTLETAQLTDPAAAWGFGGQPWGAASMPWVFIVDEHGAVRAKYQGVMGTDDIDVVLAWLAGQA